MLAETPSGYSEGATPQDVYNAVMSNTGDANLAAQITGQYAAQKAAIWNSTMDSMTSGQPGFLTIVPSKQTTTAMSNTGLMLMAGALLLIGATFLIPVRD